MEEGDWMVTDQQVRRLWRLMASEKTMAGAAAKAGMDEKTGRKYRDLGKLPSEVRRILAALSAEVGAHSTAIASTVEAIAAIDLAFAKARYGDELRASEPVLRGFEPRPSLPPGSTVRLRAARHPLLDPATVVPIDLEMTPDVYALVITGPNTGGKTVPLTPAGLLALMAQCGLHIT